MFKCRLSIPVPRGKEENVQYICIKLECVLKRYINDCSKYIKFPFCSVLHAIHVCFIFNFIV